MAKISDETMKELLERIAELNGHLEWLVVDIKEESEQIDTTLTAIEKDCIFITKSVGKARGDLGIEPDPA